MITPCHLTRPLAGTNTANMVVLYDFCFIFLVFCIAWVLLLGCYYLLRILLRLITIKAGLTLSSLSLFGICAGHVYPHPITAYIHTNRQTDTDSSMIPTFLKTATFTAYLLLILVMLCYYTNSQNGMVGGMVTWCYTTAL